MNVDQIELLLLAGALVAMLSRRFGFPATVGLVIAGLALSALPFIPTLSLTHDLLFSVLLPPLIFEASLFLPWRELRREMPLIVAIATAGLVLAALVTGAGMLMLAHWPPVVAAAFAVLIAATDPVSVIATFKEARVTGRLRLLVEAESLFNDGTAAVLFGLVIAFSDGQSATAQQICLKACWVAGGGILIGAALSLGVLYLAGKTNDHLVEITLTTVAAYGSFLLAERLNCSGILATMTAGLVVGNRGPLSPMSVKGREAAEAFWEYAAFVSNSLIFLLIGMQVARQDLSPVWTTTLLAIVLVTLGRAAAVYPIALLFARTRLRIPGTHQHVMFWGGLRGALALALAQGLPPLFPHRGQVVTVAFGVVAFSVIVQGMSMTPLLRKMKLVPAGRAAAHLEIEEKS